MLAFGSGLIQNFKDATKYFKKGLIKFWKPELGKMYQQDTPFTIYLVHVDVLLNESWPVALAVYKSVRARSQTVRSSF